VAPCCGVLWRAVAGVADAARRLGVCSPLNVVKPGFLAVLTPSDPGFTTFWGRAVRFPWLRWSFPGLR
jgi:hypothetical protein